MDTFEKLSPLHTSELPTPARRESGLCGYHLTDPPEDESHYSVYRITLEDGRAFVEATEGRIADRHQRAFLHKEQPHRARNKARIRLAR